MKTGIHLRSAETDDVIRRLRSAKVGDTIAYDELSKLACGDVRKQKYHCVTTARNALRKEGIEFDPVKDGLMRLNDEEIIKKSAGSIHGIRRAAKRGARVLGCVQNYASLPEDIRAKHDTSASLLAIIAFSTERGNSRLIEQKIVQQKKRLDCSETLALLQGPSGT